MAYKVLYRVGHVGTAMGSLRVTEPVARVADKNEDARWNVHDYATGELIGFVLDQWIPGTYAHLCVFAKEENRDGFHYQSRHENLDKALSAVLGKPGRGWERYSFISARK